MSGSNFIQKVNMKQLGFMLDFASETKVPFCIWGIKAVGKTQGVYQWCEKNKYRCVVLHLATQDVVDLIGMMKVIQDDHGTNKTIWSRPEWLKDDGIPTCYFLDEFNRGNQFVLAAMLPFLIEGKLHTHSIGTKDFVVAACNPTTGNYNVNDSFEADDALRDRCGHIILEPSIDEFMKFAEYKIGSTTMKVLNKAQHFIEIKSFSMPFEVEPSRRSIINVMSHVDNKSALWVKERASYVLGAYLGTNFRDDWLSEYQDRLETLDLYTIMNFDKNKEIIIKTLTTIVKGKEEVKNDIFENSQDQILNWLNTKYTDGIDDINWLIQFFNIPIIQKDSIIALLTKLITLNKPSLLFNILHSGIFDQLDDIKEYITSTKLLEGIEE